jgi:CheY-like chemotaxis protein
MASVLLVDDDTDTLDMYAVGLSAGGYRPITAATLDAALSVLTHQAPDVVVTDLRMSGASGWGLIDTIKKDPATRAIPVVILTGQIDPTIVIHAQQLGCAAVLMKPCLPDELARVLDQIRPTAPNEDNDADPHSGTAAAPTRCARR